MLKVSIAYATAEEQIWRELEVPEGATVRDVIETSGILNEFPAIDLTINKVGIFGHITDLDTRVKEEDRVEIYRPIIIDPQKLERKKYKLRPVEPTVEKGHSVYKVSDK